MEDQRYLDSLIERAQELTVELTEIQLRIARHASDVRGDFLSPQELDTDARIGQFMHEYDARGACEMTGHVNCRSRNC